jgi:hypothetical protein
MRRRYAVQILIDTKVGSRLVIQTLEKEEGRDRQPRVSEFNVDRTH